jgi:hypothetical protein
MDMGCVPCMILTHLRPVLVLLLFLLLLLFMQCLNPNSGDTGNQHQDRLFEGHRTSHWVVV